MLLFCSIVTGVRLADGGSPRQGRLELALNDIWGSVCNDQWQLTDAEVVCRMLNFTSALSVPSQKIFGQGTGPVWLDDVSCTGNESSISECRHRGWGTHDCDHSEDAEVICGPASSKYTFPSFKYQY